MDYTNFKQSKQQVQAAEFTRLKTNTRPSDTSQGYSVERNSKEAQKKTGKLYKMSKQKPRKETQSAWDYGTGKLTQDGRLQPAAWSRLSRDTRSLIQ